MQKPLRCSAQPFIYTDGRIPAQQLLRLGNIHLQYAVQPSPQGLAQAFIIGESFIGDDLSVLILGDNIFYGHDIHHLLGSAMARTEGASIFAYRVQNPKRYGVVDFDSGGKVLSLEEKPTQPKSNYAVTFYVVKC